MNRPEADTKLSLLDHLTELRTRLTRALIAVVILGGIALVFAKPIFRVLMAPILAALPVGQRALIQTSAVEELNTLIKVGLYAGLFLSAPVVLSQIWGFVAPGLYANERRLAVPFIGAGTLCFIAGAVFAYFVVLPPAFQFLLQPEDTRGRVALIDTADGAIADAGRLMRAGDLTRSEALLTYAESALTAIPSTSTEDADTYRKRADALDPAIDAADRAVARSGIGAEPLALAIEARSRARTAALAGDAATARRELDVAGSNLHQALASGVGSARGERAAALLDRFQIAATKLVAARQRQADDDWTRPMLSMKEQLNLVLVMLLAFAVIFEIPVVFALLAALGVITGEGLAKHRRYAIVINVIVAAVLTPTGDPFNLALMAVPMIVCYEAGVLAARIISARRKAREAAALAS